MKFMLLIMLLLIPLQVIVSAGWANQPPEIDGYLNEKIWEVAGQDSGLMKDINGSEWCNITIYLLNDYDYLYMGIFVNDSSYEYNKDEILVFFDTSTDGIYNVVRIKTYAEDTNSEGKVETQDAWGSARKTTGMEVELKIKLRGSDPDDLHYTIPSDDWLKIRIIYLKNSSIAYYFPQVNGFRYYYLAYSSESISELVAPILIISITVFAIGFILFLVRSHRKESEPKKKPYLRRRIAPH
ncbi:MAG: hypothetical protein QXL15_03490 [Candidatus Korarchaeota archaeon]